MSAHGFHSASGNGSVVAERVLRVLAITLEVAALVLLGLNTPTAISQWTLLPAWWTIFAVVALVAPALALLLVGVWVGHRTLQLICGIQALLFLLVLFLAPLALLGQRLPSATGMPWPVQLSMIAGAAAGVGFGVWRLAAYNVVLQVTVFGLVFVTAGDPGSGQALGDAVFGVFYVTLLSALAFALRRTSVVLDRTVESAVIEARAAATAEATRAARRRVASLIHDSVIVALLAYSNHTGTKATVAAEARSALRAIANLDTVESSQDRAPIAFAWELQALTTEHDPEAAFDYVTDGDTLIPATVAQAIGEATAEALRNSIQHASAGIPPARQVRVTVSDEMVEVVVLDDGRGFDMGTVPPARLGLRHGILARLETVGGTARVTSAPGYGTIVALTWARP
jgi:signal transduction histidine kinase